MYRMKPDIITIKKMDREDFGTLCICALRYCFGRETYMPSLVRDIIRHRLQDLSDKTLGVMIEDCAFQAKMNLYGDEKIDKPGWINWEMELRAEKRRRECVEETE